MTTSIPSGPAARPTHAGPAGWAIGPAGAGTVDVEGLRLPAELVTGEAVALELRPASVATRGLAWILDALCYGGVLLAGVLLWSVVGPSLDEAATSAVLLLFVVLFFVGVPVTVETATRGRSVGKFATGLRVVRDDGGPIRFRQALIRALLALLEILSQPFISVISSLVSRRGKRLGDLLAGTYVIRERSGAVIPPPVWMPPHLAPWAATADIGRIPERLVLAARGFIGRAPSLHPEARTRLGIALADQVARSVAPPPPPGTLPEHFLAAVLAERTRRELDRLQRVETARAARAARRDAAPVLSPGSHRLVGDD